ncbi:MAG: SCO family protein [bacterium]
MLTNKDGLWIRYFGFLAVVFILLGCGNSSDNQTTQQQKQEKSSNLSGVSLKTFPFKNIINENRKTVHNSKVQGQVSVLTFLYTRCPWDYMCPSISKHLIDFQQRLSENRYDDVQIIVITLDPDHDSPDVLIQYEKTIGAHPALWNFWHAPESVLETWLGKLDIPRSESGRRIDHGMKTFVIDRSGTIQKIHQGSKWTGKDIMQSVNQVTEDA